MKNKFIFTQVVVLLLALDVHAQETSESKPKLGFAGDMRYRLVRAQEGDDESRFYQQLRVRLGLDAEVNETMRAKVRLATSTSNTSANQLLGDESDAGMARRTFGIDQAYMDWRPLPTTAFFLGRTPNPFWMPAKAQTIFDADLAFEGLATQWNNERSSGGVFANFGAFIISENYNKGTVGTEGTDSADTGLFGLDLGYEFSGEKWNWTSHLGYYYFSKVEDVNIKRFSKSAATDVQSAPFLSYRGNSVYASGGEHFFANAFGLAEVGTELKLKCERGEWTIFAIGVMNTLATKKNVALESGVIAQMGGTQLGYAFILKQADSVIGALTDTDSNAGGTDNRGHRLTIGQKLGKNFNVTLNQFIAERGIDTVTRDAYLTFLDFSVAF